MMGIYEQHHVSNQRWIPIKCPYSALLVSQGALTPQPKSLPKRWLDSPPHWFYFPQYKMKAETEPLFYLFFLQDPVNTGLNKRFVFFLPINKVLCDNWARETASLVPRMKKKTTTDIGCKDPKYALLNMIASCLCPFAVWGWKCSQDIIS